MKTSATTRRVSRSIRRELLTTLLTEIVNRLQPDAGEPGEPGPEPFAFGVAPVGEGEFDLALHTLPGPDPVASLFSFTAPADWAAFGMVTSGRAHHLDDGRGNPLRVHLGFLVERRGGHVAVLRRAGGEAEVLSGGEAPCGRLPDACRRVLGLPTPPPQVWSGALWARLWVERLLIDALGEPGALSWPAAARAHPAIDHLLRTDPAVADQLPDQLVELVLGASQRFGWDRLRLLAGEGALPLLAIRPEEARWMDDGLFSREALEAFPPVATLLADLELVAPPAVVDGVDRALQAWAIQ